MTSLNQQRDAYVQGMRKLIEQVGRQRPTDLDGILDRTERLLDAQTVHLDRLALTDFESEKTDAHDVFTVLLKAQQLPRMIHAMGEVLVQQEKDDALRPAQTRCLNLARDLLTLTHQWLAEHQLELDDLEEF